MNTVVVEVDTHSLKYDNVLAIARAFLELGIAVKMWNSAVTSALDMIEEIKPDLVFHHSVTERAVKIIKENNPSIKLVNTEIFETFVVADVLAYKKLDPHPMFACEQVCVLQYPDIEDSENVALKYQMSVKNTDRFRLFSIKNVAGGKSCGWVPKEVHPLIFSSAKSVLALSLNAAVNASLCNDNVMISISGSPEKFTISEEELNEISNVNLAAQYVGTQDAV